MPYTPLGKFGGSLGYQRKSDFRRPVTFYDRVRFVGPDSTVEILGGTITGDIVLTGNLQSSDWDGGSDLSGGADGVATAGWLLDWDNGAAQFQTIYAEGGELGDLVITGDLTLSGGSVEVGDIYSDNWDGTVPLSLRDTGASVGYALDASAGSAQFVNIFADAGELRDLSVLGTLIMGTSGIFRSNAFNQTRIEILQSAADYLGFVKASTSTPYASVAGIPGSNRMNLFASGIINMSDTQWGGTLGDAFINTTPIGAATPQYSFVGDPDTGMYRSGINTIGFSTGNSTTLRLGSGYVIVSQGALDDDDPRIQHDGTASAPAYSFRGDTDTGMYRVSGNNIGFSVGTQLSFLIGANVLRGQSVTGTFWMPHGNGSVSAPTYSFYGDTNTGMYRPADHQIALTVNGTQEMLLGSTGFNVQNVYDATAGSANVSVASNGRLTRITSALKYKDDVVEAWDMADIKLVPVSFREKSTGTLRIGLIADWLAEQDSRLGIYGDDGDVEDYETRGAIAVLAAKIKRLEDQLLTKQE